MLNAIRQVEERWKEGTRLHKIAAQYGVDPGNLVRAFRKKHGVTPKEFIDAKRKELVLREMKKDGIIGYEIGVMIGMDDLAFYRWVKRAFGKPLILLRKEIQRNQNKV